MSSGPAFVPGDLVMFDDKRVFCINTSFVCLGNGRFSVAAKHRDDMEWMPDDISNDDYSAIKAKVQLVHIDHAGRTVHR
jgi:hypothetical protein